MKKIILPLFIFLSISVYAQKYQVNREKVQYLERYWQGLEEISNDEAAERFTEFYSKDTKDYYANLTQRLGLGNL